MVCSEGRMFQFPQRCTRQLQIKTMQLFGRRTNETAARDQILQKFS